MRPIDELEARQLMDMADDGCPNFPGEEDGGAGESSQDMDHSSILPFDPSNEDDEEGQTPAA